MSALFKGALMRVMRSSPQFGVTLLAYEGLRMLTASELEPRPPNNAPISQSDYDAIRKEVSGRVGVRVRVQGSAEG